MKPNSGSTAAWMLLWLVPAAIIVLPFVSLLATPFVLLWAGIRAQDLAMLVLMYALTILGITLGYHRSLAHRSVVLSNRVKTVVVTLGAMAAQGPPVFWTAHHRAHHGDPDGTADTHSPISGPAGAKVGGWRRFMHSHVGWMLGHGGRFDPRLVRDLRKDPSVLKIEHHYFAWLFTGTVLPALLLLPLDFTLTGFVTSLYWTGLVRIGLTHQSTWMVNSVCHLWGYRSFNTPDASRNNWIVAVLTLGEGWHNNHHDQPSRARHGLAPWEIDPTYGAMKVLERLGLAEIRK